MISNRSSYVLLGAALLALTVAAAAPLAAEPSCKLDPKGLTICNVPYALCDKATCIPGPNGSVQCTCPVLNGPSFGSLDQLGGSCTPKEPGLVFSLFSLVGFDPSHQLACPTGTQFAQCWNATCKLLAGGQQAVCTCPLCPGPFVTPGGSCNAANCKSQILVGAAFPVQGSGCK